jgi:UDP-N-acetylglucosamine--N-acetylmuramyl-(pentapeptide) pyrophosphoryl-undecaprenol N-acetylglucosamine transferase
MQTTKRILLTGGGTAGHVNPALAIGSVFAGAETRFLYVGVRGKVEEEVVPREGIPLKYVRASGYPSRISFDLVRFCMNLLAGTIQSLFILGGYRPEIIIGTGGYVSAPVIIAASFLRKFGFSKAKVFIHEQNAVPGKLNRLMGRFAQAVLVTFPETLAYFPKRGVLVGYPLRKQISRISREEALQRLDLKIPARRKIVLVFGGSQGSRTINQAMVDALEHLLPYRDTLFVIHGVGLLKGDSYNSMADTEARLHRIYGDDQLKSIEEFYLYRPYFHNIELLYALSDLVVARGGAGSLNEISAMGLPALIIPKSNLPGDHQVMNARSMERAGGVVILYEQIAPVNGALSECVDGKILAEKLLSLIQNDDQLRKMSQNSRGFLKRDALVQIERVIRQEKMEATMNSSVPAIEFNSTHLPGNKQLLAMLEKVYARHQLKYKPERIIPYPQDLEYMKNRASALLIHSSWQERNLGVKLLGLLAARDKIPVLLVLFNERKPVSLIKRLLGGDFEQVGFIRRNVLTALMRIGDLTPEVETAILTGLEDPYYEVRAEAAHAVAFFGPKISSQQYFISALIKLLSDPNIDVSTSAAEALGSLGGESDALPALLGLWDTKFWRMRTAVLRGIHHLVERGKISNLDELEAQVPKFILTSTDFKPHFEIKFAYRRLMDSVSRKKEKRSTQ